MKAVRFLFACLAAVGLAACGEEERAYVGYVEAEYVYVAAPQSGWIVAAPVREGDRVAAADVLFELDRDQQESQFAAALARVKEAGAQVEDVSVGARPEEIEALEAQRDEARVRLAEARAEYDRWMPLVREGNASQMQGDQVTADYRAAQARLAAAEDAIAIARLGGREGQRSAAGAAAEAAIAAAREAEWRLDQRTVRAATAGRVEEVFHRKGEYVAATAPVLSILPAGNLKVRFFVPQTELPDFEIGGEVLIAADGLSEPIAARISFIAEESEFTPPVIFSNDVRDKLVFLVEARPESAAGLRPGLPVDVLKP